MRIHEEEGTYKSRPTYEEDDCFFDEGALKPLRLALKLDLCRAEIISPVFTFGFEVAVVVRAAGRSHCLVLAACNSTSARMNAQRPAAACVPFLIARRMRYR